MTWDEQITADDILAIRVHLSLTQMQLAQTLGIKGGITTINRWEHGHSRISTAWCRLIETHMAKLVGEDWRAIVRSSPRYTRFMDLRGRIESAGSGVQLNANASDDDFDAVEAKLRKAR